MTGLTIKKPVLLIILAVSALSFGNTVMERKVIIPKGEFDSNYVHPLDIFLSQDGSASILIDDLKNIFFYTQNNLRTIDRNRRSFINGFAEDGRIMLVSLPASREMWPIRSIGIYDALEGLDKPVKTVEIPKEMQDSFPGELFTVPQIPGKYYIIYRMQKYTLGQYLTHMLSGGHGFGYGKPYLAEVEEGKISRYEEIKYGGKKVENFSITKYVIDAKTMHCLGYRSQPGHYVPTLNTPVILCYAGYDLKKKKATQNHNIYEINYDAGSYDFGPLSMASKDDEVFVVFSFHKYPFRGSPQNNIEQITSDIYYFQYGNNSTVNTVKIAEGFVPIVKLDSIGNVYVFWIDHNGQLMMKKRQDDKWSDDKIVLSGIDVLPKIIVTRYKYVSAELDSENNLHIVFPSNGDVVYAKIKLDFTSSRK